MKQLLSSITLLLLSTLAFGQVPNTFSSGETISSSKINANFSFLANAMGSGKLEAMMICKNMGYPKNQYGDSDYNDFVYGECISTDNSTDNFSTNFTSLSGNNRNFNYINLKDLFNNKWILGGSTWWAQSSNYRYVQTVFYKVASD